MTALLGTSKAIVGVAGSGKTVTAKDDVRQLLEQQRHVAIVDPTGVWWGMRASPDGKGAGFDLPIFGGEHKDVPIGPTTGAAVARVIIEQRVSAIVDLSSIDNSRDWRRFMADFVAELRKKPKGNFHLVLDEADEFAAERPVDDVGFALRENLIYIAKRGRVQGFVPTFITQRTAEIAKAVISQAQTIIAHQLIAPSDQKAIDDYLKGHGSPDVRRDVMSSLAELAVGERWIYSPRLKLLERGITPAPTTYDSSRTPEAGEQLIEPRTLAQLDVSAIAAALTPTTQPESQKSGSEESARVIELVAQRGDRNRRIAELEDQLADAKRIGDLLYQRGIVVGLGRARDLIAEAIRTAGDAEPSIEDAGAIADAFLAAKQPISAAGTDLRPPAEDAPPTAVPGSPVVAGGASDRELRALAGLASVYPAGLTEAAWAARTGYSRKGGAWIRRRARYRDAGLIMQEDGRWFATDAGVEAAGSEIPDMPPPGLALVDFWAARLGAPGRLLKVLAAIHPRGLTRDALAAEVGMAVKGGAFIRHVGELKAAELVVDNKKRLAVAPALMGEG